MVIDKSDCRVHAIDDLKVVSELLGREPEGNFEISLRRRDGQPVVITNDPLLLDGTPMPTLFWLVDPQLRTAVGRLEAAGGVREATAAVDQVELDQAHMQYAALRDARLPSTHRGPVPTGGVGGTRRGVKCLHAHLAWWLVGGEDPVGSWVARQLGLTRPLQGSAFDPPLPCFQVQYGRNE